jgi:hypothetical protein
MSFDSVVRPVARVVFPVFSGVRAMMMPFRMDDVQGTIPWPQYHVLLRGMVRAAPVEQGVAYVTIDEAEVEKGSTHRRPGLHVDGVGPDGKAGGWGGGGWGAKGMLVAANRIGCRGWNQAFDGEPRPDGDCEHLAGQLRLDREVGMSSGGVYFCSPLGVHEALPMIADTRRQFVRVSLPNECPWYEGYTKSPVGVTPTGPIHPARAHQMLYRESAHL